MKKTLEHAGLPIRSWISWQQKEFSECQARLFAVDAGRIGQLKVLLAALHNVAPQHELLAVTGMLNPDGSAELRWHRAYDAPYDAIAVRHGIAVCEKAMPPTEYDRQTHPQASAGEPLPRLSFWFGSECAPRKSFSRGRLSRL